MKKIFLILFIIYVGFATNLIASNNQSIKRISVGEKNSKITIDGGVVTGAGATDDVHTARILLRDHAILVASGTYGTELKPHLPRWRQPFIDLNWNARRGALLASTQCIERPFTPQCTSSPTGWPIAGTPEALAHVTAANDAIAATLKAAQSKMKNKKLPPKVAKAMAAKLQQGKDGESNAAATKFTPLPCADRKNLLSRLREEGHVDIIQKCILFL